MRAGQGAGALSGVLLAVVLAGDLGAQDDSASPPASPPVAPPGPQRSFQAILWLHGGPARDAGMFAAVRAAGFSAVSVSGAEAPELPGRHGLGYYHDQIVGKGILELRDTQYAPLVAAYAKGRDADLLVRPACLSASGTAGRLVNVLGPRLQATLPCGPLAVSLGDEVSVTRHANPLDFCFAPESLGAFRGFAEARYRTIDRLNATWRTDFPSFKAVRPFTADQLRRRELNGADYPEVMTPWADHREFMDRELASLVQTLVGQVRRQDPSLPCGLTGIQQPSAYGGHDFGRLLPHCSFYEAYDIGGARDLAMCFAPERAWQMATLFAPVAGASANPVLAQLGDLIAHGMRGVIVWSAGGVLAADRAPTAFGREIAAALAELGEVAEVFAGARLHRSPVYVVESQAAVRAWWMLDSRRDGATWIKRLSSYEKTHSTSLAARHGWVRLLEDLGLQPRFVAAAGLAEALQRQRPRLLVLGATIALSDAAATAVRGFVEAGGVVLADHTPALYDERLVLRQRPALDALFGIQGRSHALRDLMIDQGKALPAARLASGGAAAERGLRAEISDPEGDFHVQMEHQVGRGRAYYLNMAVCDYGRVRLDPGALAAALDLRRRVRFVLRQAGIEPPVHLRAQGMPTCLERMVLTARDGRRLLAIRVNALESPTIMQQLIARGPVSLQLMFARPTVLVDLLTGRVTAAALRHEVPLDPRRGLFFEVRDGG